MRKPMYMTFVMMVMLLLSMSSKSEAMLVTYEFEGKVNAENFIMRSPSLFGVGNDIKGLITFENTTNEVTRIFYEIGSFDYENKDWTNRYGIVSGELPDAEIRQWPKTGFMDNWTFLYDTDGVKVFAATLADKALTQPDAIVYSFSADITSVNAVPVPSAFWLLGTGIAGLAALRRKAQK